VVGASKPYLHCWRFVMYAAVVFAALAPLAGLACKGRLGGLKAAQGWPCAANIAYLTRI